MPVAVKYQCAVCRIDHFDGQVVKVSTLCVEGPWFKSCPSCSSDLKTWHYRGRAGTGDRRWRGGGGGVVLWLAEEGWGWGRVLYCGWHWWVGGGEVLLWLAQGVRGFGGIGGGGSVLWLDEIACFICNLCLSSITFAWSWLVGFMLNIQATC